MKKRGRKKKVNKDLESQQTQSSSEQDSAYLRNKIP